MTLSGSWDSHPRLLLGGLDHSLQCSRSDLDGGLEAAGEKSRVSISFSEERGLSRDTSLQSTRESLACECDPWDSDVGECMQF